MTAPIPLSAADIDFQNYNPSASSVQQQPVDEICKWEGANQWLVVGEADGNYFLSWPLTFEPADQAYSQRIMLSDKDGEPYPSSGSYKFSFDLKSLATPDEQGFDTISKITLGTKDGGNTSECVTFILFVYSNGRVGIFHDGKFGSVMNKSGDPLDLDEYSDFINISGTVDYSTNMYDITVDECPQAIDGVEKILFSGKRDAGCPTVGYFDVLSPRTAAGGSFNYRPLAIDNIKFEPSK